MPKDSSTFDMFDAHGAGTEKNQGTFPQGINASGLITGYYLDTNMAEHGFLRMADGTLIEFDAPGAGSGAYQGTKPTSINGKGVIAGSYINAAGATSGFIRTAAGAFATFAVAVAPDPTTIPNCINDEGVVVGSAGGSSGLGAGFIRTADAQIITFDFPGEAWSINAAGDVLGSWVDPIQTIGGVFVRKSSGVFVRYHVLAVVSAAINDAGTVMGTYAVEETHHGFLRWQSAN